MQKFTSTITSTDQNTGAVKPVPSAQVYIYQGGSNNLATLYQDNETGTKTNPLITDANGFVEAKLANGTYDIYVMSGTIVKKISGFCAFDGSQTSVTITMPAQFTVSGGVNVSWKTQVKNTVLAGPVSGANAAPAFRVLQPDDIPAATTTAKGIVELATEADLAGRTDGVVPTAKQQALVFLGKFTATNTASIEFKNGLGGVVFDATFKKYILEAVNVAPAANSNQLLLTASTDGGTTYLAGTNYAFRSWNYSQVEASNGAARIGLTNINSPLGNTASYNTSLRLEIYNPAGTQFTHMHWQGTQSDTSGIAAGLIGSGSVATTGSINALKLAMNSGNIASGEFILYGVRTAA